MDAYGLYGGTLLLLIGFIFGVGRRRGRGEGVVEGLHAAPLELRRIGLEQGRCVLCGEGDTGEEDGGEEQEGDAANIRCQQIDG